MIIIDHNDYCNYNYYRNHDYRNHNDYYPNLIELLSESFSFFSSVTSRVPPLFWERRGLPEIRWCQNDRIFEGFLDFPKKYEILDFWISGFLDFWIFFGFLAISRQRKELPGIRWCENDRIFEGFLDFTKKDVLNFLIS